MCRIFLRVVTNIGKWIPVVFVFGIGGFSVYAYNAVFLVGYIDDLLLKILIGIFFNIIFVLCMWSYVRTVFTTLQKIPHHFHLPMELKEVMRNFGGDSTQAVEMLRKFAHEKALPVRTCDYRTGFVRYCHKCYAVKPDRASHCSVCDQCVLKYDHHCIWVNNCVSFGNYKYFVLFLFYGFLLCLYGFVTILPSFIELVSHRSRRQGEIQLILVFFFAGMFGISLAALLFFHIYLLATNQSTVEFARPPILDCGPFKKAYDLGLKKNFLQVFGHEFWKWPLPIASSNGTGFEFPLSINCYTMVYSEDAEAGASRAYTMTQTQSANASFENHRFDRTS